MICSRDVFYELVREWEDCNSAAGWSMEEHMGDRIRYYSMQLLVELKSILSIPLKTELKFIMTFQTYLEVQPQ